MRLFFVCFHRNLYYTIIVINLHVSIFISGGLRDPYTVQGEYASCCCTYCCCPKLFIYNITRMMTSSNGHNSCGTGRLWGESTGGFPSQMPVMRSFDVFFDVRLNKRFSKQSKCRWLETSLRSLWRHCTGIMVSTTCITISYRDYNCCRNNWPSLAISRYKRRTSLNLRWLTPKMQK